MLACIAGASAQAQVVERVSEALSGGDANGASVLSAISADGRFVVFSSSATNLVANDANGVVSDVFVRDRLSQTTSLVSVDSAGQQSSAASNLGAISNDGRFVVFLGDALTPGDTDFMHEVLLRDRTLGTTTALTPNNDNFATYHSADISGDGRWVVYSHYDFLPVFTTAVHVIDRVGGQNTVVVAGSWGPPGPSSTIGAGVLARSGARVYFARTADDGYGSSHNLLIELQTAGGAGASYLLNQGVEPRAATLDGRFVVCADSAGLRVFDTQRGTSERVSVTVDALPPNGAFGAASVSRNGRYVTFASAASNLVGGDTNATSDVFLRDCQQGVTLRVSLSASGTQANGAAAGPRLTANADLTAFDSVASNLVPGDGNAARDVFVRTNCFAAYPDADGDGFGAVAPGAFACLPLATGLSLNALDCDDADAQRHPGRVDGLNGVDDDCDLVVDEEIAGAAYCSTSNAGAGCVPAISATGTPSVGASSGFDVRVEQVPGQKIGLVYYGLSRDIRAQRQPTGYFGTSFLCVGAPVQRMGAQSSGGTAFACDGVLAADLLAFGAAHPGSLATPFAAGTTVNLQGWFRDATPAGSNLSNAWTVVLAP